MAKKIGRLAALLLGAALMCGLLAGCAGEKAERGVYIMYNLSNLDKTPTHYSEFAYTELEEVLREQFPDAHFVDWDPSDRTVSDWAELGPEGGWRPGDVILQVSSYEATGAQEGYYAVEYGADPESDKKTYCEPLGFHNLSLQLYVAVEVDEKTEEALGLGTRENGMAYVQMYNASALYRYDFGEQAEGEAPVTAGLHYLPLQNDHIAFNGWVVTGGGVRFDENYRVTGQEDAVFASWDRQDSGPHFDTIYDMLTSGDIPGAVAQYAGDVTPYVRLLLDGTWSEQVRQVAEEAGVTP